MNFDIYIDYHLNFRQYAKVMREPYKTIYGGRIEVSQSRETSLDLIN